MPEAWSAPSWSAADQWTLLTPVLLALVLTVAIGLEREAGAKNAGLRTHVLVGVGSAVFMVISKYGFADLLGTDHVALDPSRIAAQIVSGIGFIGAGLIFVAAAVAWLWLPKHAPAQDAAPSENEEGTDGGDAPAQTVEDTAASTSS